KARKWSATSLWKSSVGALPNIFREGKVWAIFRQHPELPPAILGLRLDDPFRSRRAEIPIQIAALWQGGPTNDERTAGVQKGQIRRETGSDYGHCSSFDKNPTYRRLPRKHDDRALSVFARNLQT